MTSISSDKTKLYFPQY